MEHYNDIDSFRYVKVARKRLAPATQALVSLLADEKATDNLKLEALISLGQIGDPTTLNSLTQAFDELKDYIEPITALGHFKNSSPVPKLLERLDDPDTFYKDEIVRVLGEIGDPMATKALMSHLHDEDRLVRYYSARALYKMGGRDVVQALCSLLNDPDEWIVINVLDILSKLKDPEAIPSLVGQFETSRDARLKAIIISALATFAEGRLLKTFESGLDSYDPRIQANAVEAISMLKIPALEMRRKLRRFYGHPNNRVRGNLCLALVKADPDAVISELTTMMDSADAPTRRSAAYVLAYIQIPQRETYIHSLLQDSNPGVRKMALKAALTLGGSVSKREILPLLKDENQWVRKEAVECAIQIEDFSNETILELFTNENSTPVIEVLLKYFITRNMFEATDQIFQRIKLEVEEETEWLISALGHLGAKDLLVKAKKFLGPVRATVYSEYYSALLQNGDLTVFDELSDGLTNPKRLKEKSIFINVAGTIGALVQRVDKYSKPLLDILTIDVKKDMEGLATFNLPVLSPEQIMAEGRDYYLNNDFAKARTSFSAMLELDPNHIEAGYYLGSSQYKLGDLAGAEQSLSKVFALAPTNITSGILLGQIYFRNKNWDKLANCYEILKKYLKPDDKLNIVKVFGALGLAYYNQKKFKEAITVLNVGLKANPRDLSSSYHLALCHYSLGETDKAKQILESLRKTLPSDSQVLKNVLELLQRM